MKRFISIILSLITILTVICSFQTSVLAAQKPASTQFTDHSSIDSQITLKWNKVKKADGYQIQRSSNKKFKNVKKYNVKGNKTSKAIKNLDADKKYYFRIRAYKTVNDKKLYSSFSQTYSFKTKSIEELHCTNNDNHSMPTGNSRKWFNNKNECKEYMSQVWNMWGEKLDNNEITREEYGKKSPYGYECWSCSNCGKWTLNFKYR